MTKRASVGALLLVLGALACDHTDPVDPNDTGDGSGRPNEPINNAFPRQLTFNRGGDADPHVFGSTIVYSRRSIPHVDSDFCLAFLPLEGGFLEDTFCPDNGAVNGTKEAYVQPAISPDGQRIAFVEEIGDTAQRSLTPFFRRVMVGPTSDLSAATELLDLTLGLYTIVGRIGDIPANAINRLQWRDNDKLLFVASSERTLAGAFCCDTLYVPMALIEADANDGTWRQLDIGPLPPFDFFVTDRGTIRFIRGEDPALWRQFEPCAQTSPVCPDHKVWELEGDSTRIVADFKPSGTISRLFGRGSTTMVLSGDGRLLAVDNAGGFRPGSALVPLGNLENLAFNEDGSLGVTLTNSTGLPDLWLVRFQ